MLPRTAIFTKIFLIFNLLLCKIFEINFNIYGVLGFWGPIS